MPRNTLRIAAAQLNPIVGDIPGNTRRVIDWIGQARDKLKSDLIIFPELTLTGYPPEDLLLRPDIFEMIEQSLQLIANSSKNITAIVGVPIREDGKVFNAAVVLKDGEIQARYDKQCLPNYGVFDEQRYFQAGHQPLVININDCRIGITICEDIWFEGSARQSKDAGAELIVNLNGSPFHAGKQTEREAVLAARMAETSLPIIYVNQVGGQDELIFDGGSMLIDASGQITPLAPYFEEALTSIDYCIGGSVSTPTVIKNTNNEEALTYDALVCGTRDYIYKNGFKGAVIGLSGGIDSSLTLAIAVDALGAENVQAVMMPSEYTSQLSLDEAARQAETMGISYSILPITAMQDAFQTTLADEFSGLKNDTTEENLQARIRGVLLMAISNKKGYLLLTTGNKSEMAVGYATLYGDMAGGFAPLKDVSKTCVFSLSRFRNTRGEVIPQKVIDRPPSAELAPDQKDEDSLPPYDVLDPILQAYVEEDRSIAEIVKLGFNEAVVKRIVAMVARNEYKRRQAAPGVRITKRAFGRDRRYPITSRFEWERTRE